MDSHEAHNFTSTPSSCIREHSDIHEIYNDIFQMEDYDQDRNKEILESIVKIMKGRKQNSLDTVNDTLDEKMPINSRNVTRTLSESKAHWMNAVEKAKVAEDPWHQYQIEDLKPERAVRYRYNALQKKWFRDNITVKMQNESFGQGAMRKCYRMKKLSKFVHQYDWSFASNMVAKCYIEDVLPKTYIDDVKMQMDAKLWAEEFNRHCPPKKVDIIQISCIKLIDRPNTPMFHIEHFVEGDYVKYNSNSGYVLQQDNKLIRDTPQAFSHFTFERSGHQMIVVDIQGVGDLYTDPQIHTAAGCEYGEGNLGTKGMALFFETHPCLKICQDLDLKTLDLSKKEGARVHTLKSASNTSTEVKHCRDRLSSSTGSNGHKVEPAFELVKRLRSSDSKGSLSPGNTSLENLGDVFFDDVPERTRLYSEVDSGISSEEESNFREKYFANHERKCSSVDSVPALTNSCIAARLKALSEFTEQQTSILGQIHQELALYNYVGRFTETVLDSESTVFHLKKAAECGSLEANKILAYKYLQLSTSEFEELKLKEDLNRGMACLIEAATRGDKDCIIKTAKAFATGEYLGSFREKSWTDALKWYEAALNMQEVGSDFNSCPPYLIYASMAEMWRTGGYGIEKDPSYAGELYTSAADAGMKCGKGKMANKYFMLAEEAWGEVEED